MPFVREAFETLGEAVVVDGRSISAEDVRDADLLAIRSTTRVDRALLDDSKVRFVGTATIGCDHLDTDYMQSRGIQWCHSPGCNSNSVSEYVTAALLRLADRHDFTPPGKTIGVVGVGNVGRLVVEKARALGMRVLQNDPPRARAEGQGDFVALDQLVSEADVLTMHVPITQSGCDATFHLIDRNILAAVRPGLLFINAARGAVVDTPALITAIESGAVGHSVIDTWEGEPRYNRRLMKLADIVTPHIAGHSFEGKVAGTVMVYRAACRFLGVEPVWTPDSLLPPADVLEIRVDASGRTDCDVLHEIVSRVYDIGRDDSDFRSGDCEDPDRCAAHFDALRKSYPVRREFRFTRVVVDNASPVLGAMVADLGFAA